ncbi:MAG: hypothetical protein DYH07_12775 [Armatimonadetes bacterium ATM1]|nr:MAG: hypothetical protein EDM73_12535 [Armatimonadota bacterium]MCE7900947.1 hypothetical protein [Armatimonadetes bacterium ATM1]RIJ94852.1 MAG: hypothetical protein DCC45_11880 [Armatimonadota bacterium]
MTRHGVLRTASALALLLLGMCAAIAQLLTPTVRGKAMDAIRDKYLALASLPLAQRRAQTVTFARTLPEIKFADVTEDGNVACVFKDDVPYMILGNVAAVPDKEQSLDAFLDSFRTRASAERIIRPLEFAPPYRAVQAPQQFEPNDLPESLDARIANALGKCFGDSCPEVRRILTNKGYKVAAGTDASIATLMGLKGLGVYYMQCHGGNSLVWDAAEKKFVEDYILVSGEEWSAKLESDMEELAIPGLTGGLMSSGFLGTCEALYDLDANNKEINKRWFTITRKFIRTFWMFSKNSFVLIYGCTTTRISDVMAEDPVNCSVYCGMSDLGHTDCHKWIKLLYDRLTGTNDDTIPPAESGYPQRPFDWVKLFDDFKERKQLWPTLFTHKGKQRSPSPIFRPNRDNFGILTPSIKFIHPLAYQRRIELIGTFGKDPGEQNRKVEIAGVAQVIETWEPEKIVVILADDNLGASGEVKAFHKGRPSNSRWLSKWTGKIGITIAGEESLAFNADFQVNMIGDPWSYREDPGVPPVDQMIWNVYTTTGSTCTWNASGKETDSNGKIVRAWSGEGEPKCWLEENMGTQNTFGVGGVADSYIKKINLYVAIVGVFSFNERGTINPKTPIKLGDWMQGQTLFQAAYDSDFGIIGNQMEIEDEPSRLAYGGKSAVLVWDSMQCRYGMPKAAAR